MRLVINRAANLKYKKDIETRKQKYYNEYSTRQEEFRKQRDEEKAQKQKDLEKLKKKRLQFLVEERERAIAEATVIRRKNEATINTRAVANFPMPKVTIKIEQSDDTQVTNDPQAANNPQTNSNPQTNNPQTADNPETASNAQTAGSAFSFQKLHADAIQFLRTNVRTVFRKTKGNSPQYEAMKTALDELQTNFPDGMELGSGEDFNALKQRMEQYKTALKKVRDNSDTYIKKVGSFQITDSGRQRAQNATIINKMANQKLRALEEQMRQLETEYQQIKTRRENFTLGEAIREQQNYQTKVENIKNNYETQKNEAQRQEWAGNFNDIGDIQNAYEENLRKLDDAEKQYSFVESFDDLSAEHKQLFIQAKIAGKLFDRNHNPFNDYRTEVAAGDRSYENILDFKNRENAIELDALKDKLNPPGSTTKTPITYTADALITLSNLRLMDKLMGQEREKNAYQVVYSIFDKNGRALSTTELEQFDFSKLSEGGYKCLVTAIKADPIPFPSGLHELSEAKPFQMDEEGILDKETALTLRRFDQELSLTEPLFQEKMPGTEQTLGDLIGSRLQQAQDILQNRMETDAASYGNEAGNRFNITSAAQLKKKIAIKAIDYRPVRPNQKLTKRTYIKPGIVRNAGNYYDEELIANLGSNIKKTSNKDLDFAQTNNALDRKIFSEKKLLLSDKKLISKGLQTAFDNARKNSDESLLEIETKMQQMQSLGKESVFTFEKKGEISAFECEYDKQAGQLYGLVKNYLKVHEKDLGDPTSPASALQKWKAQAGFDGPEKISFIGKKKDLTQVEVTSDDEYLFQAKLFSYGDENFPNAKILDVSDKPLFPRKPSLSDIKQGQIGNCCFLSVIASMAADHPEEIENMIKDNGKTVTCRFYNKNRQPVLVTVPKTIAVRESTNPEVSELMPSSVTGETGPLWFHLMEKAYMLSGIREEYVDTNSKDGAEMLEKAREKYQFGKEEPAENVKLQILKECYPKEFENFTYTDDDDEKEKQVDLVNKRIESLFARSCFGIAGGEITDAMTILTGSEPIEINLKTASGSQIISALGDLTEENVQRFAGEKYKTLEDKQIDQAIQERNEKQKKQNKQNKPNKQNKQNKPNINESGEPEPTEEELDVAIEIYKDTELDVIQALGRIAAKKLSLEKVSFGTDLDGAKFKTVQSVSLEEMLKALDDALDENDPLFNAEFYEQTEDGPELKYNLGDLSEVRKIKDNFVKGLQNNQLKNGSPSLKVVSEKPGNYAKSAARIKDTIINNFGGKNLLNCTFRGAADRYVGGSSTKREDDLLLSTDAVSEENKGVFKNHSYTIAGYRQDDNGRFYISIRNPWGDGGAKETSTDIVRGGTDRTVTYTAASFNETDLKNGTAGTFEMELNQFISIAEGLHIGGGVPHYSKSDVAQALSKEKLNHLRQTNPELYNSKITNDKILDKAVQQLSESAPMQKAADKFIASSTTKQLVDAGVELPEERVREMKENIKEIKATISVQAQTKELSKDKVEKTQRTTQISEAPKNIR